MDTNQNTETNNDSNWTSIGSAIREIIRESRKQRVVIKVTSGRKVIDCSVLLAFILSVGAPVLPTFVILGVLVESISVTFEKM